MENEQVDVFCKSWYEKNRVEPREKAKQSAKKYYEAHKEECLARSKAAYLKNKDKLNAASKKYYKEHRAEILARAKASREALKRENKIKVVEITATGSEAL